MPFYRDLKMDLKMISHFEKEIQVFSLAWVLFFIHFGINYWVYKRHSTVSPIYGFLIEKGYQWSFGIIVGMTFIVSVVLVLTALNMLFEGAFPLTINLVIGTFLFYLIAICGLNLWGKNFLKKQGMEINSNVGWKWFVKRAKENIEKEKAKQKRE